MLRIGDFEKWLFWVGHFEYFFFKKEKKNCLILVKISHKLCVRMDGTQILWLWWFTAKNQSPHTFQPAVYLRLLGRLVYCKDDHSFYGTFHIHSSFIQRSGHDWVAGRRKEGGWGVGGNFGASGPPDFSIHRNKTFVFKMNFYYCFPPIFSCLPKALGRGHQWINYSGKTCQLEEISINDNFSFSFYYF